MGNETKLKTENIRKFPILVIHKTLFSVQSRGQWWNFPKCPGFNDHLGVIYVILMVDLDDDQPEMDLYQYGSMDCQMTSMF